MKTYFKDFSLDSNALVNSSSDLEEVINNRQNKFCKTIECTELNNKIRGLMGKLAELSPEVRKIVDELVNDILNIECICYSAAYRDGMTDLMAAVTLNRLNVTKVECYSLQKPSASRSQGQG